MLTWGHLTAQPSSKSNLAEQPLLIASATAGEVLLGAESSRGDSTVVFQHETIAMMKAERAERIEKLRGLLNDASPVIPIVKKEASVWEHITLGRASTSDIVLDDPAISNVHAHFEARGDNGEISVQDVGSSNGTYINRERLHPHQWCALNPGDCIRFGQSIYYFVTPLMLNDLLGG